MRFILCCMVAFLVGCGTTGTLPGLDPGLSGDPDPADAGLISDAEAAVDAPDDADPAIPVDAQPPPGPHGCTPEGADCTGADGGPDPFMCMGCDCRVSVDGGDTSHMCVTFTH